MNKLISKQITRRERSKQDKLERIKEVAEQLFREGGYEATTVRDISEKADVAVGTIFLYFKDKRDLLIKLYDEALEKTWQSVLAEEPGASLLENLLNAFTKLLEFHARDSRLAITYLKEVLSQDASQGWSEQLNRFLAYLTNLVQRAQERGEVRRGDALQAARNFFALYYAALTGMLSGSLTPEMTVQHFLKPALELQLNGLLEKGGTL